MEPAENRIEEILRSMERLPEESEQAGFFSECDGVCDCAKTVALELKNWMGNHKKIMGVVIAAIALRWFTGLPFIRAKMGLDYSILGASYAFSAVKAPGGLKNWMGNHKKIMGVAIAVIALQWFTGLPLMGVKMGAKMGLDYFFLGARYALLVVKMSSGSKTWMEKIIGVVIAAIMLQLFTGLPLMGAKMGLDYSLLGASYAFSAVAQGAGQMFVAEYTAAYQFVSPYITRAVVQPILVWGTTVYAGYQSVKGIKALSASRQVEAGGMKKCIIESASNYKIVKYVLNPLIGTPCRWVWGHTFGGAGTGESV